MEDETPQAPETPTPPPDGEPENRAYRELRRRAQEAEDRAAAHAQEIEALRQQHEQITADLQQREGRWTVERAFLLQGIRDPDEQEVILGRYQKLGEGAPPLGDWLTDPAGARGDAIVARLLGPGPTAHAEEPARRLPPTETAATPAPTPSGSATLESYRDAERRALAKPRGKERSEALRALRDHPYLQG